LSDIAHIAPLDPELFRLNVPASEPGKPEPSKPQRMKRSSVSFARTPLPWLTDPRWDAVYPPRTRLWLLLLIKTREGCKPVRLTNAMVGEIGLDRHAKARALAQLKRAGLVSMVQTGNEAPLVTVRAVFNPSDEV
jgi:hypothetical protein